MEKVTQAELNNKVDLSNIISEVARIKLQDPTSDAEADTETANEIDPGTMLKYTFFKSVVQL